MQARAYVQRAALIITVCAVVAGIFLPAYAMAGNKPAGVLPPDEKQHGAYYGEWSARWWTWAWTQPSPINPVLDTTGEFCAQGQSGPVWFLAGAFIRNAPEIVTRTCTVPPGKALFFPVYNVAWATVKGDPEACEAAGKPSLEACARAAVAQGVDEGMTKSEAAGGMQVLVDGKPVDLAVTKTVNSPFRVVSPEFKMRLPLDNVLGIVTEEVCPLMGNGYDCNPYYADGVYVMLAPLSAGSHTVRIVAPSQLDVTYNLTIKPKNGGNGKMSSGAASIENPQTQLFVPFVSTEP